MYNVNFENLVADKGFSGWTFRKEFPSMLGTSPNGEQIWISEDQMRVPVGRTKIALKLFLWVCPVEVSIPVARIVDEDEDILELDERPQEYRTEIRYACRLGMVPAKDSLDDKALELLNKLTRKKFHTNPYYHLVTQKTYREVFLEQADVFASDVVSVVEAMKLAATHVERNMLEYMSGSQSREAAFKVDSEKSVVPQNGWSVLVRARSGSI